MSSDKSIHWAMVGTKLSDSEADSLEKYLIEFPDDLRKRIMLLGKYMPHANGKEKALRTNHVEWIIKNYPANSIAGTPFMSAGVEEEELSHWKKLWREQADNHGRNSAVLANAANFFVIYDNELAEHFWLKALDIEPNNKTFLNSLSHLYSLWEGHEQQALEGKERICNDIESEELFHRFTDLPELSFKAGSFEKAMSYANRLLDLATLYRDSRNYGNAVNSAHTILGRLALKQEDIERAKFHLEQSAIDIATPVTTSFGPSLDLARELAAVGEKTSVIQYLDIHEKLCGTDNDGALELRYQVETGGTESEAYERSGAFLDFVFARQLSQLEFMPSNDRRQRLEDLIESTQSSIDIGEEVNCNESTCKTDHQVEAVKLRSFLLQLKSMFNSDE